MNYEVVVHTGAVEGVVDQVMLQRVGAELGIEVAPVHVANGKGNLLRRLRGFNHAATHHPWIVLVDLNSTECAPLLVDAILPEPADLMRLRVVVRAAEAWLLADTERIARFLSVSTSRIPSDPEAEPDPKATLVDIARRSRRRSIREDMVPTPSGSRRVGPGYEARLIEFLSDEDGGWRPGIAAARSESLRRCFDALS